MNLLGNLLICAGILTVILAGFRVSTTLGLVIVGVVSLTAGLGICAMVMVGKTKK